MLSPMTLLCILILPRLSHSRRCVLQGTVRSTSTEQANKHLQLGHSNEVQPISRNYVSCCMVKD